MKHSKLKTIFSTMKSETKIETNTPNEDGYIEVVSGIERVKTSNRMIRIVSTVAACSVLAAGIGTTGVFLNKNKANRSILSEEENVFSEIEEKNEIVDNGSISPFIDFRQIYFGLDIINNYDFVEYSDATYDKLAIFLNNFNWGEGKDISENELPDFYNYEGNGYTINWRKGDVWFYVYVTDDGKAYYYVTKCEAKYENSGISFYYPISESLVYDIDYEAFDRGVKDIWSSDVPDTSEYISNRTKKYLSQGEFLNADVQSADESSIIENDKTSSALQGFIREDFLDMLQNEKLVEGGNGVDAYNVVCYYKTSSTTTRRLTYYINSDGTVSLCEYEITGETDIPTGFSNYYIDINEFETVLNDILNGKYDDKYSFETTTTETTTTQTTTTETSTTITTSTNKAIQSEITDISLKNGEQYILPLNLSDFTFESSDTNVVDVSPDGIVKAVGTGKAIINIIDKDHNVTEIKVNVKENVSDTTGDMLGDVNNDGQINSVDASSILAYYSYVSTTEDDIMSLEAFLNK